MTPRRTLLWINASLACVLAFSSLITSDAPVVSGPVSAEATAPGPALATHTMDRGQDDPAVDTLATGALRGISLLHVERLGAGQHGYDVAAGEVLLRLKKDANDDVVDRAIARLGGQVLDRAGRSGLVRVAIPPDESIARFCAQLREADGVAEAMPNAVAVATGDATACIAGTYRSRQWGLDRIEEGAACADYHPLLNRVTVAVLDTGVAYEDYVDPQGNRYAQATDLANVTFAPGWDFVNGDGHPDDDHQHGTHIAGLIASQGQASGVAPGVRVMPVKVLGADKRGTELQVVEGIYYAVDHGADVINMSLSFGLGYFPSGALQQAIEYAVDKGVVLVASVGNGAAWGITYPAAFQEVIAVGASRFKMSGSTIVDARADYSDMGFRLDLLAPAGTIKSDVDKNDQPDAVLAQSFALNQPANLSYLYYAGTSQATAHVSGAAAWLLAEGVPAEKVRGVLQKTARQVGSPSEIYDPVNGAGVVQLQQARQLSRSGTNTASGQLYVNIVPWLRRGDDDGTVAAARVQVVDASGAPVEGALVAASWYGSYTDFKQLEETEAGGYVTFETDEIDATTGVAVGLQIDKVMLPGAKVIPSPKQFYSLTPASAELYSRLLREPELSQSMLLFTLDPQDEALDMLVDRDEMLPSYVMKPIGAGLMSGPLAVVFDQRFAPELSASAASSIQFTFPSPLYSGWGMVSALKATVVDAPSSRLGPAGRYVLLPLDPAMGQIDLAHAYPVLNAYSTAFLRDNRAFGDGFASSSLGDGFASSSLGDGFASSSLGDGFASSSLGDGFAASSLGSGFAASSLGSGFAASSLGSGFAASSLGAGFAASSLGAGFAASSLASGKQSMSLAMGGEEAGEGAIELELVDPSSFLTEEAYE